MTKFNCGYIIRAKKEGSEIENMNKSVYSLLLSDDFIEKIDELAAVSGVSRSVMVDRVLAHYLAEETVEMKMNGVFRRMEEMLGNYAALKFVNQASECMASVQSALSYRYNPTVRYAIELFPSGALGQLKISLRTTSDELLKIMERFYSLFITIEKKYIGERAYSYDGARFVRVFVRPDGMTVEKAGEAIAEYVADFDKYLGIYFSALSDERVARMKVEAEYAKNIVKKEVIL